MKPVVKIIYRGNKLKITYADKTFDTSLIEDLSIEKWVFPFCSKGVKWNGIYEELRTFTGESDFTFYFEGNKSSFEILKYALSETPAKPIGANNVATIIYSENPFVTKIAVNGQIFNTDRIQNRSIDEWVNPIKIRDLQWKGIFKELEEYIGADIFTVYFIGEQEFMKLLIDECPKTVDIFYRDTKIAEKLNKVAHSADNISQLTPIAITPSGTKRKNTEKSKNAFNNSTKDESTNHIPIKNAFIRNNIMPICAIVSIIFSFLPFAGFWAKSGDGIGNKIIVSGFEALFGAKEIKVGSNNSIFGLLIFLAPLIIITANYIKPLNRFKKYIAVFAPAVGIIGEFITFFDLRATFKTFITNGDTMLCSALYIGFFLLLASFILTGVVGLIVYHGFKLPKKEK